MIDLFKELRNEQVEHLIVIDNGIIIHREIGSKNNVEIDKKILLSKKDLILIHNHPEGGTFSSVDIINLVENNIKQMILVTKYFIYTINRPLKGWNFDRSELEKLVELADRHANESITLELQKENIELIDANSEKSHYIWTVIFQILDVQYSRKKYTEFIKQGNF